MTANDAMTATVFDPIRLAAIMSTTASPTAKRIADRSRSSLRSRAITSQDFGRNESSHAFASGIDVPQSEKWSSSGYLRTVTSPPSSVINAA